MYCSRCGTWVPDDAAACARCGREQRPSAPLPYPALQAEGALGVAAPAAEGETFRYGGFWRRFAAGCVDGLVLFFPGAILRELAGLPGPLELRTLSDDEMGRSLGIWLIMALVWWWYCGRLESSRWQGTLGQQLLGLRVADRAGRRISFLRASARFFAQPLSMLVCGVGYLFNLWTSRRQTLHDLIAGCVVLRPNASALAATAVEPARYAGSAS